MERRLNHEHRLIPQDNASNEYLVRFSSLAVFATAIGRMGVA